jgi:mannose/cellobiose epimerase-like protein (N-acyl-D-glucosamine 2-epimerase family)
MTTQAKRNSLAEAAAEARRWLFEDAAPLWVATDAAGLFAEQIDMQGRILPLARRLRVQARQIYATCELGRLGWAGDWRSPVAAAVENLLARGRRADGLFIHAFAADGKPLDTRADLYDHAFALFCLAHAGRALGRTDLFATAEATMDRLDAWRHPKGGFREGEIDGPPRRQNPHMHLLEASLALWQVTGAMRWKALVCETAALCRTKFIDRDSGALTEYFAEDWSRLPGKDGALVEPGHCLEWAWLFERLAELGLGGDTEASKGLVDFARRFGIAGGVAINEIGLDGGVRNANARLWPQTERLKAALARFRRTGNAGEQDQAQLAIRGLWRYLDTPLKGSWHDVLKSDGLFVDQPAPASSFYHIVCALSELFTTVDAV